MVCGFRTLPGVGGMSAADREERLAALVRILLGGRPEGFPKADVRELARTFSDLPVFSTVELNSQASPRRTISDLRNAVIGVFPSDAAGLRQWGLPENAASHQVLLNLLAGDSQQAAGRRLPASWDDPNVLTADMTVRTVYDLIEDVAPAIAQALLRGPFAVVVPDVTAETPVEVVPRPVPRAPANAQADPQVGSGRAGRAPPDPARRASAAS